MIKKFVRKLTKTGSHSFTINEKKVPGTFLLNCGRHRGCNSRVKSLYCSLCMDNSNSDNEYTYSSIWKV